ncbi:MAG: secretion protein HlyD [Sphingomonas sp.]|nr:secretion protein HlyD [Sphingomonas sp.]
MKPVAMIRSHPWRSALLALAVLALGWWWLRPAAEPVAATEQSLQLQPRPFTVTLAFAGTIAPGNAVSIVAPFDGAIRSVDFAYGSRVEAGAVLLTLDTLEITATRNEAEAAYLKAGQAARDVANWASGPEVTRARRQASAAAIDLEQAQGQAEDAKGLLDRGLISRNEYEGVEQQLRSRRAAAAAARDELQTTLAKGSAADQRAAQLELANARARLGQAERQLRQAIVRAPARGVIVRPAVTSLTDGGAPIQPGTRVARGQMIGTIARDGGLAVTFEVDESDINTLSVGQPVAVSGPGFSALTLSGKIASIAAEASDSGAGGAQTRFTATAALDPVSPETADRIRIGMSATVTVITYQTASALVIPAAALQGGGPSASVMVRSGGTTRSRPVQVGRASPEGVEITSGLKPGETVVWSVAAPAAAGGQN